MAKGPNGIAVIDGSSIAEALARLTGQSPAKEKTPEERRAEALDALRAVQTPCDHEPHARLYAPLREVLCAMYRFDILPEPTLTRLLNAHIGKALHGEDIGAAMADLFNADSVGRLIEGAAIGCGIAAPETGGEAPEARRDGHGVYL